MLRRRKAQMEHEDGDLSERLLAHESESDSPREQPSTPTHVIVYQGPFSLESFLRGWRRRVPPRRLAPIRLSCILRRAGSAHRAQLTSHAPPAGYVLSRCHLIAAAITRCLAYLWGGAPPPPQQLSSSQRRRLEQLQADLQVWAGGGAPGAGGLAPLVLAGRGAWCS